VRPRVSAGMEAAGEQAPGPRRPAPGGQAGAVGPVPARAGAAPAAGRTSTAGGAVPTVGSAAPGGSFTTVSGRTGTIASLRGQKSLLWFVATWCPSWQAGTQAMAGQAARLRAAGVRVVEVEDYADRASRGRP